MDSQNVLLICTVGGTPAPLITSLVYWKPVRVIFVATEQTRGRIEQEIVPAVAEQAVSLDAGRYDRLLLDDGQDFTRCVEQMRDLAPEVSRWLARDPSHQVAVDFTGGTKCMSAALGLHAHRWKCRFTYIGGQQRTKDGTGIVVSGSETVMRTVNPWDALGFQAVSDYVRLFDEGAFAAASHTVDRTTCNMSDPARKRELGMLKNMAEGYLAWDRFAHKEAHDKLGNARRAVNDLAAALGSPDTAARLSRALDTHHAVLQEILDGSRLTQVKDLLANARRRIHEQRWDDATARLYRAMEATAQMRLHESHGIENTKRIVIEDVPETLRREWQGRARNGTVMAGLQDAFLLLSHLDDPVGQRFVDLELDKRGSPLSTRNDSILAHGFAPIKKKTCEQLWESALQLVGCEKADLWQFPVLGVISDPRTVTRIAE